ncbi:helix-turn-helix domain-containing protein [Pseudonocardia sp. NPDC049154]|uniref:helix-turn-helix domain-containing protein n=1 Tax=Pseudonocardia sp. NPDC049154 TaxID=3155501 RepID=UPI0033CC93AE
MSSAPPATWTAGSADSVAGEVLTTRAAAEAGTERAPGPLRLRGVARVAHVLSMLAESGDRISVPVAVRRLDLRKSTAYRYLVSLEHEGLLARAPDGFLEPGPLLRRLRPQPVMGPATEADTAAVATLAARAGETALLCGWQAGEPVVWCSRAPRARTFTLAVDVGAVLQAGSGPAVVGAVFGLLSQRALSALRGLPTDAESGDVRRLGVACGRPTPDGVLVMAAPVFGADRCLRAALGLAFVADVQDEHGLSARARHLREVAAALTRQTR